jgi:TPR repeat protein
LRDMAGHYAGDDGRTDGKQPNRLKWLLKAAEFDDGAAQYEIGSMYRFGSGVEKDLDAAKMWFKKAATNGYDYANTVLKELEANK